MTEATLAKGNSEKKPSKTHAVPAKKERLSERNLPELDAWEISIAEVFCRAAATLGLRRSVGLVFGAIYCSETPLAITDLQWKLKLSRGAVVEAVQLLRRFGAVRLVLKIGERKDFYEAESDLKKVAAGAFQEILIPEIERISLRLAQAGTLTKTDAAKKKSEKLSSAVRAISSLVPVLKNLFEK